MATSTTTNPFNNNIDLSKPEGLKLWTAATSVDSSVPRLTMKVENGEQIRKRIAKRCDTYRLNRILRVPTGGNGVPTGTRANSVTNFTGPKKLLDDYHTLTLKQVQSWAACNWGANDDPRIDNPTLEIKELDLTAADASGKRASLKQQYRIRSELLYAILNNCIEENDLDLIANESDDYTFEDPLTGDQKRNGVILLYKFLQDVKPSTVIDVQDLESKLSKATLQKYDNDVPKLTREMETIWKEIKRLKPGTYSESRFLTQLFRALETTTNESFERTVETLKDMWILQDPKCTVPFVIQTSSTKYVNLVGANKWNVTSAKDTKIIALTTALNDHKKKFNELKSKVKSGGKSSGNDGGNPGGTGGNSKKTGKLKIPEWRTKYVGKTTSQEGKKWVWCKEHKSEGLFDGLYMPDGHDYAKWKKEKETKVAEWKEQRRQKKDKQPNPSGTTSQPDKLTLSSKLSTALTTKLGVSAADANKLIEEALKESGKE